MGFWEFVTNATPPVGITAIAGWVTVEKDFLNGLGVWFLGLIVYIIAISIWVWREKQRIRFDR